MLFGVGPSSQVDGTTVLVEPNRGVAKVPIINTGIVIAVALVLIAVLIAAFIVVGIILYMKKCFPHKGNLRYAFSFLSSIAYHIGLCLHTRTYLPTICTLYLFF